MKTKLLIGLLTLFLAASSARAVKIDLSGFGAQPGNSGQGTIESWIAGLVSAYNLANDPDLPAPGDELFRQNKTGEAGSFGLPTGFPTFGSDVLNIDIPGGYDYIALHWGGQGGGVYQAFYVGGTANTFTAPGNNGLSWYDGFSASPVASTPDGGSTLALLGLGVIALIPLRRALRRK